MLLNSKISQVVKCANTPDLILFSPNKYKMSDKIILKHLKIDFKKLKIKQVFCIVCGK